jgi:hypothetical protein
MKDAEIGGTCSKLEGKRNAHKEASRKITE